MRIPTAIRLSGVASEAKKHMKFAETQVHILEDQMRRTNLKQDRRTVEINGGDVIISVYSSFGERRMEIHALTQEEKTNYDYIPQCYCGCTFAIGVVIGQYVEEGEDSIPYPSRDLRLDVLVCNEAKKYIRYNNCLGSDFTRYHVDYEGEIPDDTMFGDEEGWGFNERPWEGEPVIVMLDNSRWVDAFNACCCEDYREFAEGEGVYTETACLPLDPPPIDTTYPVYRVVPLLASTMPRATGWNKIITSVDRKVNYG